MLFNRKMADCCQHRCISKQQKGAGVQISLRYANPVFNSRRAGKRSGGWGLQKCMVGHTGVEGMGCKIQNPVRGPSILKITYFTLRDDAKYKIPRASAPHRCRGGKRDFCNSVGFHLDYYTFLHYIDKVSFQLVPITYAKQKLWTDVSAPFNFLFPGCTTDEIYVIRNDKNKKASKFKEKKIFHCRLVQTGLIWQYMHVKGCTKWEKWAFWCTRYTRIHVMSNVVENMVFTGEALVNF